MKKVRIIYFAMLLMLAVFALSCTSDTSEIADSSSKSLSNGTGVILNSDLVDMTGITIEIYNAKGTYRTYSSADGSFAFDNAPDGVYNLLISLQGLSFNVEPDVITIDTLSDKTVDVLIGTSVGKGSLIGSIRDDSDGFDTDVTIYHVKVDGDYAYLIDRTNGLWVVDVSEKSAPFLIGSASSGDKMYNRIELSGDKAYVVYSTSDENGNLVGGIEAFNISDPTAPELIGNIVTVELDDLRISGDYIYAIGDKFVIVDVKDPTSPVLISTLDINGEGVEVLGNYAYAACIDKSLRIVDISDINSPVVVGESDDTTDGVYVMLKDSYAYVATSVSGLKIFDVSDPTAPVYSGGFTTDEATLIDPVLSEFDLEGLDIDGNYIYLAAVFNGALILDIYDRTNPVFIARTDADDIQFAMNVYVAGKYGYAGSWTYGFTIFRAK